MINLTSISDRPSELIQKRSESMRAEKYDSGAHTISFRVGVNPEYQRFKDWKWFCKSCGVAKTSADREAGHCTNCRRTA